MARRHARLLGPILVAALAARWLCFAGLTLGDDPGYASLVRTILDAGFPAGLSNPLAVRPLFLLPMAASVRLFGWSEVALVAPTLLASLLGIAAVYAIGALLESPVVGAVAALTVAAFPLDVVHATTLTNDIPGSAVVALGAAAGWLAIDHERDARLGAVSGFVLALAAGAKLSFLVPSLVVLSLLALLALVASRRERTRSLTRPLLLGYGAGLLTLAAFFAATTGSPLAPLVSELSFNRRFLLDHLLANRTDVLTFYPRWALLWQPADFLLGRLAPYGLLFPMLILALARKGVWASARAAFAPTWALVTIAWLEFGPLQLWPYAPIHRLPRFLEAVAIPSALVIGAWVVAAWNAGSVQRVIGAAAFAAYLSTGAYASAVMAARQQDTMRDMREAASLAIGHPGPVVADGELLQYLAIRRGYAHMEALQELRLPSTIVPPRALVIVGGSRRSELDPAWVEAYAPRSIPEGWTLLTRLTPVLEPWRRRIGVAYRTGSVETSVALAGR